MCQNAKPTREVFRRGISGSCTRFSKSIITTCSGRRNEPFTSTAILYDRLFDEAGSEYQTEHSMSDPWERGRGDAYNEYFTGGRYHTVYDTGFDLLGTWSVKNGKFKQDLVEYDEFFFENNNRDLILKKSEYKTDQEGNRYRNDHYSVLSKDYLPE
jgi:hypothetical protein